MKLGTGNWLQVKVVAGLTALVLGASALVGYLTVLAEENHASQELLSRVRQLEVHGQAIQRRGLTYANNAPRDYGPYDRDVVIFYPDFMRDLDAFDRQLESVAKAAAALPSGPFHAASHSLLQRVNEVQAGWKSFRRGFQEKLGEVADEPRLEWGAEYVRDNQALINSLTGALIKTIEQTIQQRLDRNDQLNAIAIAAAGALLLLGIIWFYASVVRRISLMVRGCQRVAQGDFGYQLAVSGHDELTRLARAFNSLSARTRFVLTMLTEMHRSGTVDSKIESLWTQASGYLPIQWLALWETGETGESMRLIALRSDKPVSDTARRMLENTAQNDIHVLRASQNARPTKFDNLPEYIVATPTARMLRELVKIEKQNSVMMVPLASGDGWHGLLMIAAAQPNAYTDEQVKLMGNLSRHLANGLAHADGGEAVVDVAA